MNRNVKSSESISFEHNLAHLLPVLERVHRRLCQEDLLAFRIDLEFLEEGIIPEMLHIIPFLDDAVIHRVADLQHRSGSGGFITAHDILDDQVVILLLLGS